MNYNRKWNLVLTKIFDKVIHTYYIDINTRDITRGKVDLSIHSDYFEKNNLTYIEKVGLFEFYGLSEYIESKNIIFFKNNIKKSGKSIYNIDTNFQIIVEKENKAVINYYNEMKSECDFTDSNLDIINKI